MFSFMMESLEEAKDVRSSAVFLSFASLLGTALGNKSWDSLQASSSTVGSHDGGGGDKTERLQIRN